MFELRTDRLKLNDVYPDRAKALARRLHIRAGEIEFFRKMLPVAADDIKIEDGERAAIRLVSTPHLDRDREILMPGGAVLDLYRENPVVLYAHDYSSLPIGQDLWIKATRDGILAKTRYANHQLADDVYQLVKGKFLRASSVGFIPVESVSSADGEKFSALIDILEKDYGIPKSESLGARRIYTKWIMLEHSDVPVPSNAQSLNIAVGKSIRSKELRDDLGLPPVVEGDSVGVEIVDGEPDDDLTAGAGLTPDPIVEVVAGDPATGSGSAGGHTPAPAAAAEPAAGAPAGDPPAEAEADADRIRSIVREELGAAMAPVLEAVRALSAAVERLDVIEIEDEPAPAKAAEPAAPPAPEPTSGSSAGAPPELAGGTSGTPAAVVLTPEIIREAVAGLDIRGIIKRESRLVISRMKGRIEG